MERLLLRRLLDTRCLRNILGIGTPVHPVHDIPSMAVTEPHRRRARPSKPGKKIKPSRPARPPPDTRHEHPDKKQPAKHSQADAPGVGRVILNTAFRSVGVSRKGASNDPAERDRAPAARCAGPLRHRPSPDLASAMNQSQAADRCPGRTVPAPAHVHLNAAQAQEMENFARLRQSPAHLVAGHGRKRVQDRLNCECDRSINAQADTRWKGDPFQHNLAWAAARTQTVPPAYAGLRSGWAQEHQFPGIPGRHRTGSRCLPVHSCPQFGQL